MKYLHALPALALAEVIGGCSGTNAPDPPRPNIIVIMTDDMGYSDPGCYGGEIKTPNIDLLAENGIRFTQMYNCARCCPSRASLLTGKYPHQVGLARNGQNLSMDAPTIAEVLREAGYRTGMAGKWHLSRTKALPMKDDQLKWLAHQRDSGVFAPLETYPSNRGFEEHWGVIWGVVDYFDPFSLVHNETAIKEVPEDFYITDFITEKSVEMIETFSRGKDPFFLYVAHTAPHWPLHALPEDIEKYRDTYKGGWDKVRNDRYRRMVEMGLIDSLLYPLPPNSSGKSWDECLDKEKEANHMAAHAAMVDRVDQGIGKILEKLREKGMYDNTLIFFLSDNGASYERGYPPGFDRPGETRGGETIDYDPFVPGSQTTWGYIGNAWASAINTPFRFWKKESYEGGACTPFIVHWPAGLKGMKNSVNRGVAHVMDILPTCIELAGTEYPVSINGQQTSPVEGASLIPLLNKKIPSTHDTLYWEHEGGKAIRIGDWKMAALKNQPWELFDLGKNRTETGDLSALYPDKVKEMNKLWEAWAERVGVPE